MKKFWIIGSSSGIGKELAKKLDAKGYNLILSSRNEEKLHQLNNELINDHEVIPLDLSDKDQCLKISRDIIEKEIENLKNYVLINNTRYGDKVKVEYFVTYGCEGYKIPKMILQPFVENAFFHAFPGAAKGNIKVLVRTLAGNLQIQIMDDGVGMTEERLRELISCYGKTEHYSGIGINNVDNRLKLMYGNNYGIQITSQENEGTTVTILLPANKNK